MHVAAACRSTPFWNLFVEPLKHATACGSGLNVSRVILFCEHATPAVPLLHKATELDGRSVVKVFESMLKDAWSVTFLRVNFSLLCLFHVKSRGYSHY